MVECPICGYESSDHGVKLHCPKSHGVGFYAAKIKDTHNQEPESWLRCEYHERERSLADIGEELGTSADVVQNEFERLGIETRTPSEATRKRWESLDKDGRQELVEDAHKTTRQLVEEGNHNFQDEDFERVLTDEFLERANRSGVPDELVEWHENNPEKVREFASRGADAREENGMAGLTGQDNPNWRGGKNVLDAVKKQLGPYWKGRREEAKDRDGWECQNCGASDCKLDSHHIVPVMCGGTHGFWNLMTLCESCHAKAEQYIRQYEAFRPALVE